MVTTPHTEHHFTASKVIRDIVIGMSDGLTVPFALAAGLSGATSSTPIIVTAGLAEIAAGAIAMGLGGYLAAKSDADHYASEKERERREVAEKPEQEAQEIRDIFRSYGLTEEETKPIVAALRARPKSWIDFMMRFELGLEAPDPTRARTSAFIIGSSYVVGGLVPLFPYMIFARARSALLLSAGITLIALLTFGYAKGRFTGTRPMRGALQTALIGGLAAGAAFAIARAIS